MRNGNLTRSRTKTHRSGILFPKEKTEFVLRLNRFQMGCRLVLFMTLFLIHTVSTTAIAQATEYGERDFSRIPGYELFGEAGATFYLHMYTDLTYWDYKTDHTLPLQFHSAQDDSHQFSNSFTALFIGSELSENISLVTQIHFHLNPIPGQVGPTVVLPQAKMIWRLMGTNNFRLGIRLRRYPDHCHGFPRRSHNWL